jgi:hypothetical protein
MSPKVLESLNGLVVGNKLDVPKLEILLGGEENRFEMYKFFAIDRQLCFKHPF